MPLLQRIAQLALKIETTEGSAETMADADAAIQVINPAFVPEGERLPRDIASAFLGGWASGMGSRKGTITFDAEFRGSGTAATKPQLGKAIRICGFSETASTNVVYKPETSRGTTPESQHPTATIGLYVDGVRYLGVGCRGNVDWKYRAGRPLLLSFSIMGVWSAFSDATLLAPTYETTVPPPCLSASFALHSFAAVLSELTINGNADVELRESVNAASGYVSAIIADRGSGSGISGSAIVEAELAATKDWFSIAQAGTTGILTIQVGSVAGNTLVLSAPAVQVGMPQPQPVGKRHGHLLPLKFCRNAGDDDFTATHQ